MNVKLQQLLPTDTGVIIYEGPSSINNSPIVAIATLNSMNVKTGPMIQTWILGKNLNPIELIKTNQDDMICGSCRHRGTGHGKMRSCYVNVGQAPLNVWRKYATGGYRNYEDVDSSWLKNRFLRIGSYGDPAALPYEIWECLIRQASNWTGYTHLYKTCDQRFKNICMASVDNEDEYREAKLLGWRTFRVRNSDDLLSKMEVVCPASAEANHMSICMNCLACNGVAFGKKAKAGDISIVAHGSKAKLSGWRNNQATPV